MRATQALAVIVLACTVGVCCRADTIFLKDGSEINGTIIEENSSTIVIKRSTGTIQSFRRADVETVVRESKVAKPAEVLPAEKPKETAAPKEVKPAIKPEDKTATGDAKKLDTKTGDVAAKVEPPKEGTAKKEDEKTANGDVKKEDPKTSETAKKEDGKKEEVATKDEKAEPRKKEDGKEETAKKEDGKKEEVKDDWTPPPDLPGFPDHAKRMSEDKEKAFLAALERMATPDAGQRSAAKGEIAALGAEALPYLVAGIQHANVEARASCMSLVGQLNGRTAVKQVLEVFYSAMPATGQAANWQVPFIRAIRDTMPAISGQPFVPAVMPESAMVQEALKHYIDWYNENFDRLPAQLGEKKIEPTDPEYLAKLKTARELKLAKKEWPRPPTTAELVTGEQRPPPPADSFIRPVDKAMRDTVPHLSREDAFKRNR
ncbi:MAG TPA: hypothetical protein VGP72_26545 [Planctomycetota bacterium]|jgi:hypothetical protein